VSQASARAALRTDVPVVVIEAPAGCGKTHEAASLAIDLDSRLTTRQEILILAHTNAAVQEFRDRTRTAAVRARAATFDSFAFELVSMYAGPLGLPSPLRIEENSGISFGDIAPKALELMRRAPSITRALSKHYPFIVLDEHQDARVEQDAIVRELASHGSHLLRIFGDPMQAIFDQAAAVDWDSLRRHADLYDDLDEPRRWDDAPELGAWVLDARSTLWNGEPLPVQNSPAAVRFVRAPHLNDPPPQSERVQPAIIVPLYRLLDQLSGSLAVLVRYNKHAKALRVATKGRLIVHEGVELPLAYAAVERAQAATGNPTELALSVLRLLSETSTGLKPKLNSLIACLTPSGCRISKSAAVRELLVPIARLYEKPDIPTWCSVLREISLSPPSWLRIHLPESLRVLGRLQTAEGEQAVLALDRAVKHRKEAGFVPYRCVSTIYKVKGRAFDHVIIPYGGRISFPANALGRRLMYVALSRARRTITIFVPDGNPSPLVGLPGPPPAECN
jgi:UvrD-like helicase family protein